MYRTYRARGAYAAKGILVYDNAGPEVRYILENRRYFAEQMTLAMIRQKHQLDDEAGGELIEPRVYYE